MRGLSLAWRSPSRGRAVFCDAFLDKLLCFVPANEIADNLGLSNSRLTPDIKIQKALVRGISLMRFDILIVSPTVFRERGFRFFFFSREEERMHVHIHCAVGEAKYWLEPTIELARNHGLSPPQLAKIREIVEAHENELINAWNSHFRN
jgi:hypothetical protein